MTKNALVFIDSNVENSNELLAALEPWSQAFLLSPNVDGIVQIDNAIAAQQQAHRQPFSIHIVSHGAPGLMHIGATELSLDTLSVYASYLQRWFSASTLAPPANGLVLYGCKVAAGDAGSEFMEKLHRLTGVTVRASDTLVGHSSKGGRWDLSVQHGAHDIPLAFCHTVSEQYDGVLNGDRFYRYVENDSNITFASIKSTGTRIYKATDQGAPVDSPKFNANDDGEVGLSLPFTFNYYGDVYSDITVGVNGGIILGTVEGSVSPNNASLPDEQPAPSGGTSITPAIFPYWDDLTLEANGSGDVYFESFTDKFVVEWNGVAHEDAGDSITFQLVLYKDSNEIAFVYDDVSFNAADYDNGKDATVGLSGGENNDDGVQYSQDTPSLNGITSLRFLSDPRLVNNAITIGEAEELTLTSEHLLFSDFDSLDSAIRYTISSIQFGSFTLNNTPLTGSTITFTQADINGGKVKFVHDASENAPSFDMMVDDQFTDPTPEAIAASITFELLNDAPIFTGLEATLPLQENDLNATSDGVPVVIDDDVSLTDTDSTDFNGGQIHVSYSNGGGAEDQLSIRSAGLVEFDGALVGYNGTAVGTVSQESNGTDGKDLIIALNGSSTAAIAEAIIETLTYQNSSETPTQARTISVVVTDGDMGTSDTLTTLISVTAENDDPVISLPEPQAIAEDQPLAFTGEAALTVADVDAGTSTVQVTLSATNGTLKVGGVEQSSHTLSDTVENINALLAEMVFQPKLNFKGQATVQVNITDQGNSGTGGPLTDSQMLEISVEEDNDAPVNTVPGAQTVDEDIELIFSDTTQITVEDTDAGLGSVEVTLAVNHGTLSLSGTAGLQLLQGDGIDDPTIQVKGTLEALNTAIDGLTYQGNEHFYGVDQLTIITDDLGNTGLGGALTDTDTVQITVDAVNDKPVNTVPGVQIIDEDKALVFTGDTLITIADADANAPEGNGLVQVTLAADNGTLFLNGDLTPLTFLNGDGTDDPTIVVRGSVETINAALDGLTYRGNPNITGSDVLTITTNDQGNFGSGGTRSTTETVGITITALNDSPVITGFNEVVEFTEEDLNQSSVVLDDSVTLVDADSSDFDSGYLRVSYPSGSVVDDQLSFQDVGIGTGEIGINGTTVTYEGTEIGTITSDGRFGNQLDVDFNSEATLPAVEALLETLTYQNTSDDPIATRTIEVTLNDGDGGTSTPLSTLIVLDAFNDKPTIVTNQLAIAEEQTITLSNNILKATDADSNDAALTFEVVSVAQGRFLVDGQEQTQFTQKTLTDGRVEFQHDGGEVAPTYEIRVRDEGEPTAASSAAITFTNVNDDPVLTDVVGTITVNTLEVENPTAIDTAITLSDVDSPDFDGGSLIVSYVSGGGALQDQLGILNQGTAAGQIAVNLDQIFYGGVAIGRFDSTLTGVNGAGLKVNLNSNATIAAAQALTQAIAYYNSVEIPTSDRTVAVQLQDGDGGQTLASNVIISITREINGSTTNDAIQGKANDDIIFGLNDDDRISGSDGDDVLYGGAGRDRLKGGNGNDRLYGSEDKDNLSGGNGNDKLYGGSGADVLKGGKGNDILHGEEDNDKLVGSDGRDKLYGDRGNDRLNGGKGNDQLYGEDGNDRLTGLSGNDELFGGKGNDRLKGGQGNDLLTGFNGNDRLDGGNNNDRLDGGQGRNQLIGGKGKDVFVLDRKGYALIKDFSDTIDRIELTNNKDQSLFGQLGMTQKGKNTILELGNKAIAKLMNVSLDQISEADFEG